MAGQILAALFASVFAQVPASEAQRQESEAPDSVQSTEAQRFAYCPFSVVAAKAKADDPLAIRELLKRFKCGAFVGEELRNLLPTALARQAQWNEMVYSPSVHAWTDLLAAVDGKELLPKAQREQFCDQQVRVKIKLATPYCKGEKIPVGLSYVVNAWPDASAVCKFEPTKLRIGDQEIAIRTGMGLPVFLFVNESGEVSVAPDIPSDTLEPGAYRVECVVKKSFYTDLGVSGLPTPDRLLKVFQAVQRKKPEFTTEVKLTAEVKILPPIACLPFGLAPKK